MLKTVSKIGSVAFPGVSALLHYICNTAGVFYSLQSSLCYQITTASVHQDQKSEIGYKVIAKKYETIYKLIFLFKDF